MIKVELTPGQAEELRNHYILELEKLQERSAEILRLLKSMGHETGTEKHPVKEAQAETPPPPPQTREEKTTNPRWSQYVVKLLKEKGKPLSKDQIFKTYEKEHNVNLSNSKAAKNSLSQSLHWLKTQKDMIISRPRKGKRGNLYEINPAVASTKETTKAGKEKTESA